MTMAGWDAWEAFLERVRGEREELFVLFSMFGFVGIGDGVVTLTAPKDGFARVRLRYDPELRTLFKTLVTEHLEARVELQDNNPSAEAPSLVLASVQREVEHRQAVAHEVATTPEMVKLLQVFRSARLVEVTPLQPPPLPPPGERGLPNFDL